jgi:predicted transcriptional regulator
MGEGGAILWSMARVLISLPDDFLADVDALARREKRSRSEMIREALRFYMAAHPAPAPNVKPAGDAATALGEIQRMRRDLPADGDMGDPDTWLATWRNRNG